MYDLIIIGYGAGGFAAAIKATELTEGKVSIALIGNGPIGGTCVNVGCVPSKYMIEASNQYFYSLFNKYPGITLKGATLDFKQVMIGLRNLVDELRNEKYEKVLNNYENIDVFKGSAEFLSGNEVKVITDNGEKRIKGKKIIIATGSRPSVPPIEGLSESGFMDSNNVWSLDELPENIAVIGGGAIGLEFGQAFLHFGSKVTIFESLPRIAYLTEPEISQLLENILRREGMQIYTRTRIIKVTKRNERKIIEYASHEGKKTLEVDEILIATGRKPNTDALKLENAHVNVDDRGFIKVDKYMRTSNPNVYAVGDVVSKRFMLETLAAREGVIAAINALGGNAEIDYLSVPWAIFTTPQVAAVGYTEEEFMKLTGACSCRVISLSSVAKARILRDAAGLVKITADPNNGRIVGVHVLSNYASEYITEAAIAIRYGLGIEDLIDVTHIFPTLSEGIKLAAQAFIRDISKMSCCVE
jgi:mercuric reductase